MSEIYEINFPKGLVIPFFQNTTSTIEGDQYCINCKKGLWAVCGQNRNDVYREAIHYFQQYYSDGEYEGAL